MDTSARPERTASRKPLKSDESNPPLAEATRERVAAVRLGISLDWWAVIAAVVLAALVHFNVLPDIGWFK